MNTVFKILWFEDELTWYNMEKLRIEEILRTHYLTPKVIRQDGDDFKLEDVTSNDYDLIFMDYKLAEGTTGDTLVEAIRNSDILTDILFYSSEEQNMLTALTSKMPPIDGVYLTKRDYTIFTEKAKRIIQKIVKRSEDIVNLRGFVLDNTSNFEVRIREILNLCWHKFSPEQQKNLTTQITTLLEGKKGRTIKQVETAKKAECIFTYTNNDPYLLGIADKLDILNSILLILLEEYDLPANSIPTDFKKHYVHQINKYRNKLGHISLGEKTISLEGKDIMIDQALHRLLRKNIAEIDALLKILETYVTTKI